jgi:hypothetical protein
VAGLAAGSAALAGAGGLALVTTLVLNVPFLGLLHRHGGMQATALGSAILVIELLAAGIGSAYGIATFVVGRKY